MKRREFIGLLGGATAWPLAAHAQQPAMPVIGIVTIASREATLQASWYHAFHERFFDHGWVPGKTITIEYRFADNDRNKLASLAQELSASSLTRSLFRHVPPCPPSRMQPAQYPLYSFRWAIL